MKSLWALNGDSHLLTLLRTSIFLTAKQAKSLDHITSWPQFIQIQDKSDPFLRPCRAQISPKRISQRPFSGLNFSKFQIGNCSSFWGPSGSKCKQQTIPATRGSWVLTPQIVLLVASQNKVAINKCK